MLNRQQVLLHVSVVSTETAREGGGGGGEVLILLVCFPDVHWM